MPLSHRRDVINGSNLSRAMEVSTDIRGKRTLLSIVETIWVPRERCAPLFDMQHMLYPLDGPNVL